MYKKVQTDWSANTIPDRLSTGQDLKKSSISLTLSSVSKGPLVDQILQQQAVSGVAIEQEYLQPKQLFARQKKILRTGPTPGGEFWVDVWFGLGEAC